MLSAQGIEPGSVGMAHFLELPRADSLKTDLDESRSSRSFLQGTRNKEFMQSSPEKLGIRAVDMSLVYDRLIEFQDMYEVFSNSPEPITILNNQRPGDLYANLFSKFLMPPPPGQDESTDNPSGLRVQISTLFRILNLKGVWYDFSLVEWRIRLGQLIWSDPEPVPEHEPHPLWTEREIFLLQITLACELLVRLDAVSISHAQGAKDQVDIGLPDIIEFLNRKSKKLDWDLVLAKRFLENILVVKSSDLGSQSSDTRTSGFLQLIGMGEVSESPRADVILLPQRQMRQLTGLKVFAETLGWPCAEDLVKELISKLGIRDSTQPSGQPTSPMSLGFDTITPSSISVYGTPLQTPRSGKHLPDGYFGHVGKPALSRNDSRSLRIPLLNRLSSQTSHVTPTFMNVGGWLSRSCLTGLILPGEAISHFLISTLLENDTDAIAQLGDSANLYGGFTYAGRTYWSKNSIVARVFAVAGDAKECMGWVSFPQLPAGLDATWHSIHSDQLPMLKDRLPQDLKEDLLALDSSFVPKDLSSSVRSADLALPSDPNTLPALASFVQWDLTPLNPDLMDDDVPMTPFDNEVHVPSIAFTSAQWQKEHVLTLSFDVQFITSWPCASPSTNPASSLPQALKRSLTGTISRNSSRKSTSTRISRRNSHGFEPLLSHPPDSVDIAPQPLQVIEAAEDDGEQVKSPQPMQSHPLHVSHRYKIVPVVEVLGPEFSVPFDTHHKPVTHSASTDMPIVSEIATTELKQTVLVLDARSPSSSDLELLARAWCAEKGYHAVVGRTSRTCLSCCIREARGLGLNVVIRV
jgi:hypothetical protein